MARGRDAKFERSMPYWGSKEQGEELRATSYIGLLSGVRACTFPDRVGT